MSWAESEKLNEWIERAYENGKREEQERIIKLLEEETWHDIAIVGVYPPRREHSYYCLGCKQIALIKGENND